MTICCTVIPPLLPLAFDIAEGGLVPFDLPADDLERILCAEDDAGSPSLTDALLPIGGIRMIDPLPDAPAPPCCCCFRLGELD